MTKVERDQKVKEFAELEAKIQSQEFTSPFEMRKLDKLRSEICGDWKIIKSRDSKRVTSFTRDRR